VRTPLFFLMWLGIAAVVFGLALSSGNDYVFFAGYVVLQYVVLSTAWNILGGYCGYVNFGSAAFFALGAYSTVAIYKFITENEFYRLPMPVLILIGGAVSGLVGFGMGYLTLRLRGAFFAIATLALAVVLQTLIVNWDFVGGSRGAYILRPEEVPLIGSYIKYLFLVMLLLAVAALVIARLIERSRLGYGFATIRDDELAAEASGVPTLKLKLIATTISGALMGMAGAPFPYYIGYLQPSSTFGLDYAVNSIAMPLIGSVAARGLTTDQLSSRIAGLLRQGYVRDPHVAVEVEAYRPFFILGEVTQPGQYPYVANMTVETAVAIAGGFTPRGYKREVIISRNYGNQAYRFKTPITAQIQPGDTIQVEERWF